MSPVGRKFYVEMGAFAPKLAEQDAGKFLTADELDRFQLLADSLTVVIVHGLVSSVVGNRGRDKLAKQIIKALKPMTPTPAHQESANPSPPHAEKIPTRISASPCAYCNGRGYVPGDPEGAPIEDCPKCTTRPAEGGEI